MTQNKSGNIWGKTKKQTKKSLKKFMIALLKILKNFGKKCLKISFGLKSQLEF